MDTSGDATALFPLPVFLLLGDFTPALTPFEGALINGAEFTLATPWSK